MYLINDLPNLRIYEVDLFIKLSLMNTVSAEFFFPSLENNKIVVSNLEIWSVFQKKKIILFSSFRIFNLLSS